MRAIQAVARLGSQSARLGCRRFHPNSPGDVVPSSNQYVKKIMPTQKFMCDQLELGIATHETKGFSDRVWFHIALFSMALAVGNTTYHLIYKGCHLGE